MTDYGNEADVAEAERQQRIKAELAREELQNLLSIPAMRSFVWTLLCECGINNNPFCGENTHESAFKTGEQNIGLKLIAMIDGAKPHSYMSIYTENRKDLEDDG